MLQEDPRTGWYTPTKAVTRFLDAWRRGEVSVPVTVDALVAIDTPPSVAPRALRTLKGLELLDEIGSPTADLRRFGSAEADEEARATIAAVVRRHYADVFSSVGDVEVASEQDLVNAFANYEPATQRDRMVGLFLGLCQFSGLVTKPRRTGRRPAGSTRQRVDTPTGQRSRRAATETRTVQLESGAIITLQVTGGLLQLSPGDLEFVFDLVRRIDTYETRSSRSGHGV